MKLSHKEKLSDNSTRYPYYGEGSSSHTDKDRTIAVRAYLKTKDDAGAEYRITTVRLGRREPHRDARINLVRSLQSSSTPSTPSSTRRASGFTSISAARPCGEIAMPQSTQTRRDFLKLVGTGAALAMTRSGAASSRRAARPNVLVILADDLGYGDLSCYGATDLKSPNIDKLIAAGMRFGNFYANCPVCSPTRAALMTGPLPGPRRRARRDPHAHPGQLGLLVPTGRAAAADAQTRRLSHGARRQMAPGPGGAEHCPTSAASTTSTASSAT